jgi:hypothetical protein
MKSLKTALFAGTMATLAFAPLGAGLASTASASPMKQISVEGHLSKFTTMADFTLKTMHETLVVDTDAMTHVTEHGMKLKVHSLKPGWLLTVKGPETSMTVHATSIVVDTM